MLTLILTYTHAWTWLRTPALLYLVTISENKKISGHLLLQCSIVISQIWLLTMPEPKSLTYFAPPRFLWERNVFFVFFFSLNSRTHHIFVILEHKSARRQLCVSCTRQRRPQQ